MEWDAELYTVTRQQLEARKTRLILLIDDDENVRNLVKSVLAPEYRVMLASDAINGIELINREVPDLVFLDINMPQMNGMEALDFIITHASDCRVVMLSARSTEANINTAMEKGATGFLTKPFDISMLLDAIKRSLE